MKKTFLVIAMAMSIGVIAFALSFRAVSLDVPSSSAISLPSSPPPIGLKLFAINTGEMYSRAVLAYRGGSFDEQRTFNAGAILVRHPRGSVLFDAGFGSDVDAHVQGTSWVSRKLTRYKKERTVAEQLKAAGVAIDSLMGIVLTHAHWDHVSGLADLPGVPVLVNQAEREFIDGGDAPVALAKQLGTANYRVYEFNSGPYLGFTASHDLFGDGSVVLVPAPGHTPGSIIAFITLPSSQRYALVGDLVWQKEGIELPAERPWLARSLVDSHAGQVRQWIVHMHQVQKALPGLIIVPAHDQRVWKGLPPLSR